MQIYYDHPHVTVDDGEHKTVIAPTLIPKTGYVEYNYYIPSLDLTLIVNPPIIYQIDHRFTYPTEPIWSGYIAASD